MKNKKLLALLGSILLIVALSALLLGAACAKPAPAPTPEEKPMKMAVQTGGIRTDGTWSQQMYEAFLHIQKNYPEIELTFADVQDFSEFVPRLEAYGAGGVDLVYHDSSQFEALVTVSPKYLNTRFVMPNITDELLEMVPENVTAYTHKTEEGGYMSGIAAGMITKTNKIAYVAGFGYPEVNNYGNAFELGAKSVNPDIELSVMYTGSWIDPEKGYESAKALIAIGVDVIAHQADTCGAGVFRACQEMEVYAFGEARDQIDFAPNWVVTSFIYDHPKLAEMALLAFKAGTIKKEVIRLGLRDGLEAISPIRNVPEEVKAKVLEAEEAIKKGVIVPPVNYGTPGVERKL